MAGLQTRGTVGIRADAKAKRRIAAKQLALPPNGSFRAKVSPPHPLYSAMKVVCVHARNSSAASGPLTLELYGLKDESDRFIGNFTLVCERAQETNVSTYIPRKLPREVRAVRRGLHGFPELDWKVVGVAMNGHITITVQVTGYLEEFWQLTLRQFVLPSQRL